MSRSVSTSPTLDTDVWHAAEVRHPVGSVVHGVVRVLTNYGAFVEIAEGVDGLVHASDPGLALHGVPEVGERIQVRIGLFDPARRRVGLALVGR
jgi:small subunit ribosomal protein S1